MNAEVTEHPHTGLRAIPRGIWALGFVSLFMDISSEMIHGLLPVFLTTVLGASAEMVGLIEGIGEATASITKLFSGWISDRLGKRKALTIIGYGLGALSKPLFAIAPTASVVLGARFSDRVGKGIRGAPRDAMVGDMVPAGQRGGAYGLWVPKLRSGRTDDEVRREWDVTAGCQCADRLAARGDCRWHRNFDDPDDSPG